MQTRFKNFVSSFPTERVAETFDAWFNIGPEEPHEHTSQQVDHIIQTLNLKKRHRILDLGCGTGRHLRELHRRGYRYLTGVDVSAAALQQAKNLNPDIEYHQEDFRTYLKKHANTVDVILSLDFTFTLYLPEEITVLISYLAQHLRSFGQAYIELWNLDAVTMRREMDRNIDYTLKQGTLHYQSQYNDFANTLHFIHRFTPNHGQTISLPPQIHYLYADQHIQHMADSAGLTSSPCNTPDTSFSRHFLLKK